MKKNGISIGLYESLSRGFNWLLLFILPFLSTPETYGQVVYLATGVLIISSISVFGQDRAVLRLIDLTDNGEFSSAVIIVTIVGLLASTIYYYFFLKDLDLYIAIALIASSLLLSFYRVYCSFLRKVGNDRIFGLARLGYTIPRLFLSMGMILLIEQASGYVFAELISIVLIFILTFYKVNLWGFRGVGEKIKEQFLFGFPLFLHVISSLILSSSDKLIIAKSVSLVELGNYNFMYSFASSLIFVYAILATIYEPQIYNKKTLREARKCARKLLFTSLIIGCCFSFVLFLMYWVTITYFTNGYSFEPYYLLLLLLSHIIYPLYLYCNYIFVYMKDTRPIAFCSIISSIFVLLFNVKYIPVYGIKIAVATTFFGYSILIVFIWFAYFTKLIKEDE